MDGHDYEYLVARYLKGHGYAGAKVTKASGDYGVDVTAHKGGHKFAVQCKYYSKPVGISAVQEAAAGKAYYGCDAAMVVTNNTFTKAARDLAKANGVILLEGVTSASGALSFSKGLKAALWIAYLFLASAIVAATADAVKGQNDGQAAYNVICVAVLISSPFWIRVLWKLVRKKIKQRKAARQATPDDAHEWR